MVEILTARVHVAMPIENDTPHFIITAKQTIDPHCVREQSSTDAEEMLRVFKACLPMATIDALLIGLLEHKRSSLVVRI